jgi:hypothetical protein
MVVALSTTDVEDTWQPPMQARKQFGCIDYVHGLGLNNRQ